MELEGFQIEKEISLIELENSVIHHTHLESRELSSWIEELSYWISELSNWIRELYKLIRELLI